MKKTLLASSLASLCIFPAIAYAHITKPSFDGFYAGIAGGFNRTTADVEMSFTNPQRLTFDSNLNPFTFIPIVFPVLLQTSQSLSENKNSGMGNIWLGYGHSFRQRYYAGIEGFVNYAQRKFDNVSQALSHQGNILSTVYFNTSAESTSKVTMQPTEYGADFRVGMITDAKTTLLYGKIGAAFNKIGISTTTTAVTNFAVPEINYLNPDIISIATSQNERNVAGLRLGLGIEQLISCHWAVRADYTFTDYGRVSTTGRGNINGVSALFSPDDPDNRTTVIVDATPNGLVHTASTTLKSNAVLLGLSYYF